MAARATPPVASGKHGGRRASSSRPTQLAAVVEADESSEAGAFIRR